MPPAGTTIGFVAAHLVTSSRRGRRLTIRAATVVPVLVAIGIVVAATLAGAASPASAHPLGMPQSVRLGADDRQVWVRWTASTDDLSALGIHLGVLGSDRTFVDDQGILVPEQSDDYDSVLLARSPELSGYLLEHIQVSQSGVSCRGRVTDTARLAGDGARLIFACFHPVEDVSVRIDTLTDIDPAYRTLAVSDTGERTTYSLDDPEHRWQLDGAAGLGGYPMGFWVTGLGLVVVAVPGASCLLLRRLRTAEAGSA